MAASGPMEGSPGRSLSQGRCAKIICTLGPSTNSDEVVDRLLQAGMDAARINLGLGTPGDHVARIRRLCTQQGSKRRPVAIIADLPGRRIRIGRLEGGRAQLEVGDLVTFARDRGELGNGARLPVDDGLFHDNMARGDQVLLSDGLVELVITKMGNAELEAEVIAGGAVMERTGVHAPGMPLQGGPLTQADLPLLKMAVEQRVDYLALTYITDASEILAVREQLEKLGASIPLIVKIERLEAFARLDGILKRSDAIMIRRGDLGAQIEVTRVPLVQKEILRLAQSAGVPVIIATQMLGSMISSPTPTRAEASDVSNAIADGADGVLLSSETAIGKYPVESVSMMARIISETERERIHPPPKPRAETFPSPFADTTASIAVQAAEHTRAKLIACFTESGRTARLVSKYRPSVPIIAFCSNDETRQRLAVHWGVRSDKLEISRDVETTVKNVEERLLSRGLVRHGDRLVIVFGAPVGEKGHTNSVRLHEVGGRTN